MKTLLAPAAILGLIPLAALAAHAWSHSGDRAAVERAVLDYCEAFYEVKPEYIARSVHKDLHKFGYSRGKDGAWTSHSMTHAQASELASKWNKDGRVKLDAAPKKVEVYDIADKTACAKLTAHWGIDYLLLVKEDGRWLIREVLWQSLPKAEGANQPG